MRKQKKVKTSKKRVSKVQSSLQRLVSFRWFPVVLVVLVFGILGAVYIQFSSAASETDKIKVIEHNQTEGPMLDVYWKADVLLFSETDHKKIKNQSPDYFDWYFPDNDPHQAIGWNTKTMKLDPDSKEPKKTTRFHQSGGAEGWLDYNPPIATPARYIHEVDLVNKKTGVPVTVFETWWLNSWRTEERRRQIVKDTTIPKTQARFKSAQDRGRVGIAGGDFNHISYNFNENDTFPGWGTAPRNGLDRMFWTNNSRVKFEGIKKGPKTGEGNQHYHYSWISEFTLKSE